MQGALVKRARGVETRASRDAESVRVRFFPRRSQDTDALVLVAFLAVVAYGAATAALGVQGDAIPVISAAAKRGSR